MTACKYAGPNNPRIVIHRHADGCDDQECAGCMTCSERHCVCCGKVHVHDTWVCPSCVGPVRDDLATIVDLHSHMLTEATHRGVDSEAAMMAGPAADVEAWQHRAASAHVQRVVPGWHRGDCDGWAYRWKGSRSDESMPRSGAQGFRGSLDAGDAERLSACRGCLPARGEDAGYLADEMGDLHPLIVLGTWDMEWRSEFDQPTDMKVTVRSAADYLERQLDHAARHHPAFDEMAADVRRCVRRLEDVLHDGEREQRSQVPCTNADCRGARLVLSHGRHITDDRYVCLRCHHAYDSGEYARAKMSHLHSEGADRWVRLADGMAAIPRPEFTIRSWIRRGLVTSKCDIVTHRLWVWWPDLRRAHVEATTRQRSA